MPSNAEVASKRRASSEGTFAYHRCTNLVPLKSIEICFEICCHWLSPFLLWRAVTIRDLAARVHTSLRGFSPKSGFCKALEWTIWRNTPNSPNVQWVGKPATLIDYGMHNLQTKHLSLSQDHRCPISVTPKTSKRAGVSTMRQMRSRLVIHVAEACFIMFHKLVKIW